ncbi:MAG: hypothetical protein RSA86_07865 [Christensenellaceae bacterium]
MRRVYKEENHIYQIDFNAAEWATDELNNIFHDAKVELSDVDFIGEIDDEMLLIEYKNSAIPNAANAGAFDPSSQKSISKIARKYYDSCIYLDAIGKKKARTYVYILEYPNGDSTTRKMVRNKIQTLLPFKLQKRNEIKKQVINEFQVLSIDEWNANPVYGRFPLTRVGGAG